MVETRDESGDHVFRELGLSGNVLVEYPHPVGAQSGSLSPDGQQYLYVKLLYGEVALHDVRKNTTRVLFDPDGSEKIVHLGWSADQRTIVFVLRQLKSARICFMRLDSDIDRSKCFGNWLAYPSLSPNGKMLAYWERTQEAPSPIWTIKVQEIRTDDLLGKPEGTISRNFNDWKYGREPIGPIRWSPDSGRLVFALRDDPTDPYYQLFRMELDSNEVEGISLNRPWWNTFWRRYLVPMDKNGFGTDFQWLPYTITAE
jgi:Tol biopolymer transport system component